MSEIRTVTIIGAGTMGHSLALAFAQGGYTVWLNDLSDHLLARAMDLIAADLQTLVEMGLLEESARASALGRIHPSTSIEEAGKQADLVIEAIIEDREAKKALFRTLDRVCPPHTILASNTSYLNIFQFVKTNRPDKVLITHWFAPPHIIPLVEIVRGPETAAATIECVHALLVAMGKKPIVVSKFLPGFIVNRLQSALTQEALHLLDNGYATPEEIDMATKAGFGLRIPILGVVKRMDYTGLDLTRKILSNAQYSAPPQRTHSKTVDELVGGGKLGVKTGSGYYEYGGRSPEEIMRERDVKLIRLKEFLQEMGEL